ncbi:MAG TPA: hypothetical protein VMU86_05715, partial [Steroidobacteraceae bacterium]|nr:hypothetical protein [Steroidobacteraceae bacterium]
MSKPTSPVRSAERQRLGEAISRHAEAAETVRRVEQAIQTISESRIADHASIGRARDAVHVARGA